jgi:peroxiredoxin
MPALTVGTSAPDVKLQTIDGKPFSLRESLERSPVVLAFFKISCPICQYAFPFLERIHRAYADKNVAVVGVSQNGAKDTASFIKEYGVTFPVLLDDTRTYTVSNAYGLTNVPTVFWIAQDSEIEVSSVGWVKKDIEEINRRAAQASGDSATAVFHSGEQVADFRAG